MAAVGGRRRAAREAAVADAEPVGPAPEARIRIVRTGARRLVADQQLEHHGPREFGALAGAVHLHALGWLADAGGREHPLPLDLDPAGAAIAVGAVAGLPHPAQIPH